MDVSITRSLSTPYVAPTASPVDESHSSKHGFTHRSDEVDVSEIGDSHVMSALETITPPLSPLFAKTHKDLAASNVPSGCVERKSEPVMEIKSTGPHVCRGCTVYTA